MGRPKDEDLPEDVEDLRARILAWRLNRMGRAHMPEEIWAEAVRLAKTFGTCRVARAVGLDYMGLRRKTERFQSRSQSETSGFLELPAEVVLGQRRTLPGPAEASRSQTTVEVTAPDGAQLRMQVPTAAASDLAELVNAFLRRAR